MEVMKRLDRAMYAIFLLVLLADVARAHASVPPAGDAGLILSAASQLQAGSTEGAILTLRRSEGSSTQIATLACFALTFSGWSDHLHDISHAAMRSQAASPVDVGAGVAALSRSESAAPSTAIFEHTGSPAP
jgi:hypothetical protein